LPSEAPLADHIITVANLPRDGGQFGAKYAPSAVMSCKAVF